MIRFITRKEIAETKKVVASEIAALQQAFFEEDVIETAEDEYAGSYRALFDLLDLQADAYVRYYKVMGFAHKDINSFTEKLAVKLNELFAITGSKEFIIVAHLKQDFFGNRDNKFKPLLKAYQKLEKIVGNASYREAFLVDQEDIPELIDILFWLQRCDPCIPEYIFFFDTSEKLQFNLCKYGNLHVTEFGREMLTGEVVESLGWQLIEGQEYDQFSNDGKNEGRKIKR